jgi:hypothetical protein
METFVVQHIPTGDSISFRDVDELVRFLMERAGREEVGPRVG